MIEDEADNGEVTNGSSVAEESEAAHATATGLDGSSVAEESEAAHATATGLDGSSAAEETETVDELEDRVRDLQGAMEKIQSGDLDAAERAIEALEQRMSSTRD